jgi:hypothetical protein
MRTDLARTTELGVALLGAIGAIMQEQTDGDFAFRLPEGSSLADIADLVATIDKATNVFTFRDHAPEAAVSFKGFDVGTEWILISITATPAALLFVRMIRQAVRHVKLNIDLNTNLNFSFSLGVGEGAKTEMRNLADKRLAESKKQSVEALCEGNANGETNRRMSESFDALEKLIAAGTKIVPALKEASSEVADLVEELKQLPINATPPDKQLAPHKEESDDRQEATDSGDGSG